MRISVVGPPNSGKSTFAASLKEQLERIGVKPVIVELDLASPTLKLIQSGASERQFRAREKQTWTRSLARKAARAFFESDGEVVLGDAPGKISEMTSMILVPADAAVILIRDDMTEELPIWRSYMESLGIPVVLEAVSTIKGKSRFAGSIIPPKAVVRGLQRKTLGGDKAIVGIARHLKILLGKKKQ